MVLSHARLGLLNVTAPRHLPDLARRRRRGVRRRWQVQPWRFIQVRHPYAGWVLLSRVTGRIVAVNRRRFEHVRVKP